MTGAAGEPILDVRNLATWFDRSGGALKAVDDISYTVAPGEALAIVGESGSGKSVGVRTLLGLQPPGARVVGGQAFFRGRDLLTLSGEELRRVRGKDIGLVFQNAMEAMNPTVTIEKQLTEHLLWHDICGKREARERAIDAMAGVGIPEPERRIRMYPFQLSGGMRQRAMIAMATVTRPALVIADEPTTAVDVTIQRQILELLRDLKNAGTALIMITHDLGVARFFCDRVAVMYAGKMMELGPMTAVIDKPYHPYTRGLLESTVDVGDARSNLRAIPGAPPDLTHVPAGCPFHPRCASAEAPRCQSPQELAPYGADRLVACWKGGPNDTE